jgi:hypothetical protein
MKNTIGAIMFVGAGLWLSPAHAADCYGSGQFHYGTSGTALATVKSGVVCSFPMNVGRTVSLKIVTPPKNGIAKAINLSTLAYQSKRDFKGKDTLVFTVENARLGTATMTMNITVR